jgi:membrane-associated protease RseP (regulator of RpoE activity)
VIPYGSATARHALFTVLVLATAVPVRGQQGDVDANGRSRDVSERLRLSLERQSRVLSEMQRSLELASRAEPRQRDSILRVSARRLAELGGEISRVQLEASTAQRSVMAAETRAEVVRQLASARALANVTRALAGQQRMLTFSMIPAGDQPRGYLGVTISGSQIPRLIDGKMYTEFASPSIIETVQAGSPAAKGGLEAGDTIVAFGKLAIPAAVPLVEMLTPGARVAVKIRRRGSERTIPIVIEARPQGEASAYRIFSSDVGTVTLCRAGACPPVSGTVTMVPNAPNTPGVARGASVPRANAGVNIATSTGFSMAWSSGDYSFAGAIMTTISDDLEELTGVREGILVLRVAPGTQAAASGLRGGDVIVRIAEEPCVGVQDLQRAVQLLRARGDRRVELAVLRQKKERTVELAW